MTRHNKEMELLPFFLDLLKCHFPGMVGASESSRFPSSDYSRG